MTTCQLDGIIVYMTNSNDDNNIPDNDPIDNNNIATKGSIEYLPSNPYTDRALTAKQVALLDNLEPAGYDPIEAARIAGYADPYAAVRALSKEISQLAEEGIAHMSLKSLQVLKEVLFSDKPVMNLKEKINVAQDLLDRSGHAKKSIVDHTVDVKGGIFILPDKAPKVVIDGEYEDI